MVDDACMKMPSSNDDRCDLFRRSEACRLLAVVCAMGGRDERHG